MEPQTQAQIDGLIQFIENAEDPATVTNEIVAAVLKYFMNKAKEVDGLDIDSRINRLSSTLDTLVSGNAANTIESFNEVIEFLAGVTDDETLSGLLLSLRNDIEGKTQKAGDRRLDPQEAPVVMLDSMGPTLDSVGSTSTVLHVAIQGDYVYSASEIKYYKTYKGPGDPGNEVVSLGPPQQGLIYCNKKTGLQYRWAGSDTGWVQVGGDPNRNKETWFIKDNKLCISTQSFVTVTEKPTITTEIQSDGRCLVTITNHSNASGATIRYSTDGSTPATEYTQPFYLDEAGSYTIRSTAQGNGRPVSEVATATTTVLASSVPEIEIVKTSSNLTISATGSGTVVLEIDGEEVANPYTVARTTSDQALTVVATNKESNKLITAVTRSVTVPKITVITVEIRDFVKRVAEAGGHLIFGEPADWSAITAEDWEEGYNDSVSPATFDQSQVTNTDLLEALEATQEKYDEHTLLLGTEPALDFLGYKGSRTSPTGLLSVYPGLDTSGIASVKIDDDGLIYASTSQVGSGHANIKWPQFTSAGEYRMAVKINGTLTDFNRFYIYAKPVTPGEEDGFLNTDKGSVYYYTNGIFQGFPNAPQQQGVIGRTNDVLCLNSAQSTSIKQYSCPYLESLHITRSGSTYITKINGETASALDPTVNLDIGSPSQIARAYMQMKANCPMLVLAGVKS